MDDGGTNRVVHRVVDNVVRTSGEGVGFHRPARALAFNGDTHRLLPLGLPVDGVESVHTGRIRDQAGGAGNRQQLHENHAPSRRTRLCSDARLCSPQSEGR